MPANFSPLIEQDQIAPRLNELARSGDVRSLLDDCLGPDFLPNRARFPFRITNFDPANTLYVRERIPTERTDIRSTDLPDYPFESAFGRYFWREDENDSIDRRRLCVLGGTGTGKSTLVDFYLRWFCPELSDRKAEFANKLIIWYDGNAAQTNEQFYHAFFPSAQAWIRSHCQEKGIDIRGLVGARNPQNVQLWVNYALEELSQLPRSRKCYLVIFIDNMDQCSVEVQQKIITMVENWLNQPSIRIWRVILTMWPSTFNTLKATNVNLVRNWTIFETGQVRQQELVEKRRAMIRKRFQDLTLAPHGGAHAAFGEFLDFAVALWIRRLGGQVLQEDGSTDLNPGEFIRDLCYGDLRRELSLLREFLKGEGAYKLWKESTRPDVRTRASGYELMEALLLGSNSHLTLTTNHVGNLFMLGHQQTTARDMLVGPHMLFLMENAPQNRDKQAISATMHALGYALDNIEHCFSNFRDLGILHEVLAVRVYGSGDGYDPHPPVFDAYRRLLFEESAYLDCVASVTSVDDACLKEMSSVTRPHDAFCRKVEQTLAFLRFLKRMEERFCETSLVRADCRTHFKERLATAHLPSVWRKPAVLYRKRLEGLRRTNALPDIDGEWWESVEHSPILNDPQKGAETLCAP